MGRDKVEGLQEGLEKEVSSKNCILGMERRRQGDFDRIEDLRQTFEERRKTVLDKHFYAFVERSTLSQVSCENPLVQDFVYKSLKVILKRRWILPSLSKKWTVLILKMFDGLYYLNRRPRNFVVDKVKNG